MRHCYLVKTRYKPCYQTNIQQCNFPVEFPGPLSPSLISSARTSTPKMFMAAPETSPSKGCVLLSCVNSLLSHAKKKLSAWRFMMPLPHALESLLSILVAVRQDNASDIGLSSSLSLRQSYATALIRLVNGLVDPLQSGTYARSILSIAAQIGLPAWLVELRHAATHEDLPSLELLRDGAKEVSRTRSRSRSLSTIAPCSHYFFPPNP